MNFTATDHLGSTRVVYRRRSFLDDVGRPVVRPLERDLSLVTHTVEQRTGYYASGLPVDYGDATVTDRLHIGNEWLNTGGLGYYNNTARLHDPILGRFHVHDSYADSYQWLSPYTHCAANPINQIDPSGRKFTEAAETAANKLIYEALVALDKDYYDFDYYIPLLELTSLRISPQLFDVKGHYPKEGDKEIRAATGYNPDTHAVTFFLPYGVDCPTLLSSHEFKHGHQFLREEICLAPMRSIDDQPKPGNLCYDYYDEVAAYCRGFLFGGEIKTISELIESDDYKGALEGQWNLWNRGGIYRPDLSIEKRIENYIRIANYSKRVFHIDGKTYYPDY